MGLLRVLLQGFGVGVVQGVVLALLDAHADGGWCDWCWWRW